MVCRIKIETSEDYSIREMLENNPPLLSDDNDTYNYDYAIVNNNFFRGNLDYDILDDVYEIELIWENGHGNRVEYSGYRCRRLEIDNIDEICSHSFNECDRLEECVLSNIGVIREWCFYEPYELKSLSLSNIERIENCCFWPLTNNIHFIDLTGVGEVSSECFEPNDNDDEIDLTLIVRYDMQRWSSNDDIKYQVKPASKVHLSDFPEERTTGYSGSTDKFLYVNQDNYDITLLDEEEVNKKIGQVSNNVKDVHNQLINFLINNNNKFIFSDIEDNNALININDDTDIIFPIPIKIYYDQEIYNILLYNGYATSDKPIEDKFYFAYNPDYDDGYYLYSKNIDSSIQFGVIVEPSSQSTKVTNVHGMSVGGGEFFDIITENQFVFESNSNDARKLLQITFNDIDFPTPFPITVLHGEEKYTLLLNRDNNSSYVLASIDGQLKDGACFYIYKDDNIINLALDETEYDTHIIFETIENVSNIVKVDETISLSGYRKVFNKEIQYYYCNSTGSSKRKLLEIRNHSNNPKYLYITIISDPYIYQMHLRVGDSWDSYGYINDDVVDCEFFIEMVQNGLNLLVNDNSLDYYFIIQSADSLSTLNELDITVSNENYNFDVDGSNISEVPTKYDILPLEITYMDDTTETVDFVVRRNDNV